ncbi:MAG TPA: GxxExxY protein [Flavisolibacter sp.]|nr:GxxExxY protein [Flavisolibacter sp.]
MDINTLTGIIVDCSVKVHTAIGPGCFERIYEELLYHEFHKRKIGVRRQVTMPINYDGLTIDNAYKLDLLIEEKVVVEIKSVEYLLPVHFKQVMSYLRLLNLKNGIILNFKTDLMKEGIHRVFNNVGQ